MPEPAHHMMVTGHGGKVYVFGGGPDLSWQATASIFVYDPATDAWAEAGSMPERRMSGEAVSLGDFIYLVGGTGGTTALLRYEPGEGVLGRYARPRAAARACSFGGFRRRVVGHRRALGRDGRAGDGGDIRSGQRSLAGRSRAERGAQRIWRGRGGRRKLSSPAARFLVRGRGRPLPALRCMTRSRARGRCCRNCRRAFMGCPWPGTRGRRSF